LEEIPDESESYDKIAVRIIGCGIEPAVRGPSRVEMFGFEKDAALADSGIDKEIAVGEITNLLVVLHKEI